MLLSLLDPMHPSFRRGMQASNSISRTIMVVCPPAKPNLCNGICQALSYNIPDIAAAAAVPPNTPPKLHLLLAPPADAALLPPDAGAKLTYYFPFGASVVTSSYNFDICPQRAGNATPTDCATFATDQVLPPAHHCYCHR